MKVYKSIFLKPLFNESKMLWHYYIGLHRTFETLKSSAKLFKPEANYV